MRKDQPSLDGYTVMTGERTLGRVTNFWLDERTHRPAFASVKTGLLRGREHVLPLHHAELDERRRVLHVPYSYDLVKTAPAHAPERDLTREQEEEILQHYRQPSRETHVGEAKPVPRVIPLHAETIDVGRRVVRADTVRLRKVVRTKIVHQPVEVRYEEIVLERLGPDALPDGAARGSLPAQPFAEGEVVFPEYREEPVVSKHAEVVAGLRTTTRVETEQRNVHAAARREEFEIERLPPPGRSSDPAEGPH